MIDEGMREYKTKLQEILDVFVGICERYNLKYYLGYGTLLGAIRHNGFIPWDDDIDVEMPVEDYKVFCKVAEKELGSKYFFQSFQTDKCLNVMWSRIRENNTTSMPVREASFNIHYGIDIDIFPLVGVWKNSFLATCQKILYEYNETLLQADYYKLYKHWNPNNKIRFLYHLPRYFRHLIIRFNNIFIYHDFMSSSIGFSLFSYENKRDPHDYRDLIKVKFEKKLYNAPHGFDSVLKGLYGDYMTPPPLDKRRGHSDTLGDIIFDTRKDYREYKEEMNEPQR